MVYKVLLLGGTGYIGGAIAQKAHESKEFEVCCLVRASSERVKSIEQFGKVIYSKNPSKLAYDDIRRAIEQYDCFLNFFIRKQHVFS